MATISATALTGVTSKSWQLQTVKAEVYDSQGNETVVTFTNFSNEQFLEEFGGYAAFQITFFENRNFEAVYKTAEGDIPANGRWNIQGDDIILEQSTGDEIFFKSAKLNENELKVGYEFLMFNHGILELSYSPV
jgi:hypothetical protein